MKKWSVSIPIVGFVRIEVEAENRAAAIEEAWEHVGDDGLDVEWGAQECIAEGNVLHAPQNEIEVDEIPREPEKKRSK